MITLLNTSILTTYGQYNYSPITLEGAQQLVSENDFQSAIGHQSTAVAMSTLLKVDVSMNRIFYQQQVGEKTIVFKLKGRPEEGKILTLDELYAIGFEWGLLERIS